MTSSPLPAGGPEPVPLPAGFSSSAFEHPTSLGPIVRRVVRFEAPGPTVILIHEVPGLSASTFAIAAVLIEHGYRVVMPALLDAAGPPGGRGAGAATMIRLCVSRELAALASGRTGAIVEWLRGLAAAEGKATAGRPVGVVGMCMSGGFALAMIPFSPVSAAVLSQPALPFVLAPWRSDLGLSGDDLVELRARVGAGECVRALRFSRDRISPRKRMRLLQRTLPAAECVEIETSNPRLHSVLGRAVDRTLKGRLGEDVQRALDDTIAFLDRHLKPDA